VHVVIAGGGVAGLEALLALSALAEDLVEVDLISPSEEFIYRPMLVAEPFGSAEILRLEIPRIVREAGAEYTKEAVVSVDPAARTVTTGGGGEIRYDALLIALGATPVEAVPGAHTFGDEAERGRFTELLAALGRRGVTRLAFVVPRAATWSIAAYELALLTAAERDARRLEGVELALVTHEAAPLDLFGSSASELVAARLEEAQVSLQTSSSVDRFEDGHLRLSAGEPLAVDAAVALPALEVPRLPGLPQRLHGFVQTDAAMHVAGLEAVWAAGDATWFPIKQGGLAAQQADAVAEHIAARAGAPVEPRPFSPVLRGLLLTGREPRYLRNEATGGKGDTSAIATSALWWPPAKVAGRFLAPYLATSANDSLEPPVHDRDAVPVEVQLS
jgi:sulfide:quinone oxidoreductase